MVFYKPLGDVRVTVEYVRLWITDLNLTRSSLVLFVEMGERRRCLVYCPSVLSAGCRRATGSYNWYNKKPDPDFRGWEGKKLQEETVTQIKRMRARIRLRDNKKQQREETEHETKDLNGHENMLSSRVNRDTFVCQSLQKIYGESNSCLRGQRRRK